MKFKFLKNHLAHNIYCKRAHRLVINIPSLKYSCYEMAIKWILFYNYFITLRIVLC